MDWDHAFKEFIGPILLILIVIVVVVLAVEHAHDPTGQNCIFIERLIPGLCPTPLP